MLLGRSGNWQDNVDSKCGANEQSAWHTVAEPRTPHASVKAERLARRRPQLAPPFASSPNRPNDEGLAGRDECRVVSDKGQQCHHSRTRAARRKTPLRTFDSGDKPPRS